MGNRWRGIEEFVAVATTGSFAGAGRLLQLPTSTISRAVVQLEREVQNQLIYRTTRKVVLTETGRLFVAHCRRIIAEREEAFAAISDSDAPSGELRLTCSTAMGERFIAPILIQFCIDHPQINVTLDFSNRLVDLIAEGYDLAIRTGEMTDSGMVRTRVATRRMLTCASPAYIAKWGSPANIGELASHECLMGSANSWHFREDGRPRSFSPKGRWRCNNGESTVAAALAGMGICHLPEFYLLKHVASGALTEILPHCVFGDEPIWAVYLERRHLMPKVRLVVDRLREQLGPAMVAL